MHAETIPPAAVRAHEPTLEPAIRRTAFGGRFLVVGFAAGGIPKIPMNLALLSERSLVGVLWGGGEWSQRNREASAAGLRWIGEWIAAGRLAPAITRRLGLAEVPGVVLPSR